MKYQVRKGCFETNSSSMHSLIVTKKNSNVRMTQEEIRDEFCLDSYWSTERTNKNGKEVLEVNMYSDNEFDRSPFSVLSSFDDKLKYAIAEYCGNNYDAASYVKGEKYFNEVFVPLLIKLTGCDEVKCGDGVETFYIYSDVGGEYLDEVEEVPYRKRVHRDGWERGESYYESHDVDGRPIEEACFEVPNFGSIDHQSSGLLRRFLANNNLSLEDYLVRKDVCVVIDGDEVCELGNLIGCGLIDKDSIVLMCPDRGWLTDKENNNEETN